MPVVDIKGVGKAQFPDEMPVNDIKTFLRNKYFQDVAQGNSRALDPQPQTAANVNPSLIETAGQKVSDYLFDQGIISDRYRAQEVGKSIAGLGEFLPVIGDATAGDDFGKAAAQGDKLGMGVGLLGAVPVLGDVVKQGIKLSKPKQKVNQYGDSVQLTEIQKDGENIGAIEYLEDKDSITILRSDVVDSEVKKGYGTEAYTQLINKALKEGKTVKSDATVSDSAQGVYNKLKSSGYDVQKNPIEYNTRSGITTTDRNDRIKQRESAPVKTDKYGNVTSAPYRVKGEPVYTIKPSTNNTNNSVDDLADNKITVYHGTDDADFEDFDLSMIGDSTYGTYSQEGGEAIYTASDIDHAKNYGKYIKELEVDTKDYYKLDMKQELKDVYDMYESYQDVPFNDWLENLENNDNLFEALNFDDLIGNEIKRQKKKGYKGIVADFSETNFSDIVTPFNNDSIKQIKTIKRESEGDKYYD